MMPTTNKSAAEAPVGVKQCLVSEADMDCTVRRCQ